MAETWEAAEDWGEAPEPWEAPEAWAAPGQPGGEALEPWQYMQNARCAREAKYVRSTSAWSTNYSSRYLKHPDFEGTLVPTVPKTP